MSLANASNDANVTGVTNVTNVDFFEAAVEMNALNVTSLVASTAAWLIAILLFSAVIWYERNGFEKHQVSRVYLKCGNTKVHSKAVAVSW